MRQFIAGLTLIAGVFPWGFRAKGNPSSPFVMSYSGRLMTNAGEALRGPVDLEIRFYRDPSGGNPIPVSPVVKRGVPLVDGVFQVDLTELSLAEYQMIFSTSQNVWVEVVDLTGKGPYPRQRMTGVPYAFKIPVDENTLQFDSMGRLGVGMIPMNKVVGLDEALSLKASAKTSSTIGDIVGLQPALDAKASTSESLLGDVTGTLKASAVTRIKGVEVDAPQGNNLFLQYNGSRLIWTAPAGGGDMASVNNLSDVANKPAARTNLGLGGLAIKNEVASAEITDNTITDGDISPTAQIADSKLATISTAGKVSGSAITSGTIGGTTSFSGSGGIVTSGPLQGASLQTPVLETSGTNLLLKAVNGQAGILRFQDSDNSNFVGFRSPGSVTTDTTWVLPASDGSSGSVLKTNGNGSLSWGTIPSAPVTSVSGRTGAVTLSFSDLSGTLPVGNISGTLPVVSGGTGATTQSGARTSLGAAASGVNSDITTLLGLTAALTVNQGGTGLNSLPTNSVLLGNGTSSLQGVVAGTNGNVLISNGTTWISSPIPWSAPGSIGSTTPNSGAFTSLVTTGSIGLQVKSSGFSTGIVRFDSLTPSYYVGFKAPDTITASRIWTLPAGDGSQGQMLATDGAGNLAWSHPGGVEVKQADYTVSSLDRGKFLIVSGTLTTITLPAPTTTWAGFSVTLKTKGAWTKVVSGASIEGEGATTPLALPSRSVVQLVTEGSAWFIASALGPYYRGSPVACASSNCYTTTAAMAAGLAYTVSLGKALVLENGVWVQADGNNVLNVDGSDTWHLALNANGRSQSATNLNKTLAKLGGRVCPTTVYVNDTLKVATGRCLYYDAGTAALTLGPVTEQTSAFTLGTWDTAVTGGGTTAANWYEGNNKYCADKGMRLPVLYETTASTVTTNVPADPASPTFSTTTGVPSPGGYAWTASAETADPANYFLWTGAAVAKTDFGVTRAIRCVVP